MSAVAPALRSFARIRAVTMVAVVAASAASVAGCGPHAERETRATRREVPPQWQDVFDGTPEIYAVIRPQAIKRDAVYGALFKSALHMAQARSEMRGVTTLEALEGAEEIVIGVRKDPQGREDAALVLRGVPASLDVARMTDTSNTPVFRLVDPRARVPEFEWADRRSDGAGAVFVLPDRTWVGTVGDARVRARQAFVSPFGRPAPEVDPKALAVARFEAAAVLASPRLAKSSVFGPLVRKLRALTLALMPGKTGVQASFQYENEDASAWAEMHLKRIVEQLSGARPSLAWLKDAHVTHEENRVIVTVAVPPRLLEELPKASASDLPL
ncbi:MAG: hypothetical protein JWP97_181 [Labilithrix sp.]|nr:hypothetical protein [Labilithrix sp.]